jgi:c-di-GMP-binding flagellar brake protein YcgR
MKIHNESATADSDHNMSLQVYFKPSQKLLLKIQGPAERQKRTELMTGYVDSVAGDLLVLTLPYGDDAVDHFPFSEGLPFEITTEALGMGIRTSAEFKAKLSGEKFSVRVTDSLQMFQRRLGPRLDCQLGIRYSRAAKSLQTMREIWERNLTVLHSPEAPLIFDGFKQTSVNISSGGIRFAVKPPANQEDLCLILINLDDSKPPICTIAEIVWTCMQNKNIVSAGMRYINILSEDQRRIEQFIDNNS